MTGGNHESAMAALRPSSPASGRTMAEMARQSARNAQPSAQTRKEQNVMVQKS